MSQSRPTTVHRFVVRQTVEESILGLRRGSDGSGRDAAGGDARAGASSSSANSPGRSSRAPNGGSPNKRARKVEEAKVLSWETVHALFS